MAEIIPDKLSGLGLQPQYFISDASIPEGVDVVFTFAPYGQPRPIFRQLANIPSETRLTTVHWNTEGIPDLRIPWYVMSFLSATRSWIGRLGDSDKQLIQTMEKKLIVPWERRVLRYRYVSDYHCAYRTGLLNVFSD